MNTENNKIIAEFMGYENIKSNKEHPMYKIPKFAYTENNFGSIETIDTFSPYFDDMVFHSDWNWLMEVVEKIERYLYDEIGTEFKIDIFAGASIYIHTTKTYIHFPYNNSSKIEAVYNACLEFIKWYNTEITQK